MDCGVIIPSEAHETARLFQHGYGLLAISITPRLSRSSIPMICFVDEVDFLVQRLSVGVYDDLKFFPRFL